MKTETRKYQIVKHRNPEWYNDGIGIEYKNKVCPLSAGTSDRIAVLRYDKNHFFVISYSQSLDYIGAEVVDIRDMTVADSNFWQYPDHIFALPKSIFDYTDNYVASYLANNAY